VIFEVGLMEPIRGYYSDGSIRHERWYVNDELHRLDGPADICYYEDGPIRYEQWFVNGELHRLGGAAWTLYNGDGSIMSEHWWVNDINIDIIPWLKENNITAPFSEADLVAIKLRWC
jgi:antitoxin component YwqK of YwqJK toxin-antitoxin module